MNIWGTPAWCFVCTQPNDGKNEKWEKWETHETSCSPDQVRDTGFMVWMERKSSRIWSEFLQGLPGKPCSVLGVHAKEEGFQSRLTEWCCQTSERTGPWPWLETVLAGREGAQKTPSVSTPLVPTSWEAGEDGHKGGARLCGPEAEFTAVSAGPEALPWGAIWPGHFRATWV